MAPTADNRGYYLADADGEVRGYGTAGFSCYEQDGRTLNAPVVGIAVSSMDQGCWLVASDGGVFALGNATFFGSMGGARLAAPVVGMATTQDRQGYWLVGSDGGVFAFGDAAYEGSLPGMGIKPISPIVGIAPTAGGP
ncbi:MAG: hypothetical protein ACYDD4_02880 [Acidimicrobiales bacterium]